MRTVTHAMGMSLDGYINGPDGSFDWSAPDEELHQFHNDRVREQSVQFCGRRLYELMRYWEADDGTWGPVERDFAEVWHVLPKVVFSSTLTAAELGPNARLATASPADEVRAIEEGIVGVGGATLAAALAREDLIDEYGVFLHPVLVGSGTPFFAAGIRETPLTLVEQRAFAGGVTHLRYRR
ncbi:MAG: dihydrofolate reductase family protein [Solirubrobacteraceae bacterium]|jgi:dihydrofolate reductase|nr:dihydrofolate reductase family protein [Solirubrobacteraceae bacterium]